jgi:hypothetical protein
MKMVTSGSGEKEAERKEGWKLNLSEYFSNCGVDFKIT